MLDVAKIKLDFPFFKANPDVVYLDTSATSIKPQIVLDAEIDYYTKFATNTHNEDSDLAFKTVTRYEQVRAQVAKLINAKLAKEVVFTSGATFGANQIAFGLEPKLGKEDVILLNKIEHSSNLLPWYEVSKRTDARIQFLPLIDNKHIDVSQLASHINSHTKVLSFANISNTLSYQNDVKQIVQIARAINPDIIIVVDAAQGIGHLATDVQAWDVDFLFFSAHKIFGPTGIGAMYGKMKRLEQLRPLLYGGSMNARVIDDGKNYSFADIPARFEAGTQNIAGIFGFGAAIDYVSRIGFSNIIEHEAEVKHYFVQQAEMKLKDKIIIYNADNDAGTVVFNMKDVFAQDVADYLGSKHDIIVRAGDHCAKLMNNFLKIQAVVRASFYLYNDKADVDRLIDALIKGGDFLGHMFEATGGK